MDCPSCQMPMEPRTLPKNLGGEVEIDLCKTCDGIWFDDKESLQLAPAGTIQLFKTIAEHRRAEKKLLSDALSCTRCQGALTQQFDMVKTTRFTYFRCAQGHGRFITFFQFLREKNFITQLTPKEVNELRAQVQVVNCSNCGAPVDLQKSMTCSHCDAPVSVLDPNRVKQVIDELNQKASKAPNSPEMLAMDMELAKMRVNTMYAQLDAQDRASNNLRGLGGRSAGQDLVILGFNAIRGLLRLLA
ncbi:MAG: zf-TFIIB domain-containing protein [Myxococcaceae bacterium]